MGTRSHRVSWSPHPKIFSFGFPSTLSHPVGSTAGKLKEVPRHPQGAGWEPCQVREGRPAGKPLLCPHPSCSHAPLGQSKPGQTRGGSGADRGPWGAGTGCSSPPHMHLHPEPQIQGPLVTTQTGARSHKSWIISKRNGLSIEIGGPGTQRKGDFLAMKKAEKSLNEAHFY